MNNIEGIDSIKLAVKDIDGSSQFLKDMGLCAVDNDQTIWTTLSNARIVLEKSIEDKILEVVWGVKDTISPFQLTDPSGLTVKFQPSEKVPVKLTAAETNGWGSINRVNRAIPLYETVDPIEICHVVVTANDIVASEKFYTDLGFVVSDRLVGRGVFMRSSAFGGHHDLFLIQSNEFKLHHVAITVKDIYQVFAGGLAMESKGWKTELGPGRHPISSSFFWYFNSPLGGMFEYTSNEDFLTEEWVARDFEYTVGMTTEWAVEGGIDPITKRQRK